MFSKKNESKSWISANFFHAYTLWNYLLCIDLLLLTLLTGQLFSDPFHSSASHFLNFLNLISCTYSETDSCIQLDVCAQCGGSAEHPDLLSHSVLH